MKTGKSLAELAAEITRQAQSKRDFIADSRALTMAPDARLELHQNGNGVIETLPLKPLAHRQLGERIGIPAKYYDRMLVEQPDLLATNVNTWLHKNPEKRMVRALDGQVRAFLSDRFRPLENVDLAEAVLPVIRDLNVEIVSAEITDTKFYLKAVDPSITKDVPTGRKLGDGTHVFFDTVCPAIVISNSEVGCGALSIETAIWTKVCTNLAVISHAIRKYHVGAKAEITDEVYALLTDKTRLLTDAAVWSQVRDVVKAAFDAARFQAITEKLAGLSEQKIDGDLIRVVEVAAREFQLSETERGGVLNHLIQGGDLSRYGFMNAITRFAGDVDDYDRSSELEKLGGNIIELEQNQWARIAEAGMLRKAA